MPIDVTAETTIARSRSDVARFASDPDNDSTWISGIVEAKTITEPPFGVGTKVARVAKFLGKRMHYTPEVVEYQPEQLVAMQTDNPFDMTITYRFEDAGEGTRVVLRIQGEGSGFFKLVAPLLAGRVKKNISKDLAVLKGLMESN